MLKWGFTRTFPGNQDATLKYMSEITFIRFCFVFVVPYQPQVKGMPGKSYNYQNLVKDSQPFALPHLKFFVISPLLIEVNVQDFILKALFLYDSTDEQQQQHSGNLKNSVAHEMEAITLIVPLGPRTLEHTRRLVHTAVGWSAREQTLLHHSSGAIHCCCPPPFSIQMSPINLRLFHAAVSKGVQSRLEKPKNN